jgi:hypothetical protein
MPRFLTDLLLGIERGTRGLPQSVQAGERLGLQREQIDKQQAEQERERKERSAKMEWEVAMASKDPQAIEAAYRRMQEIGLFASGPQATPNGTQTAPNVDLSLPPGIEPIGLDRPGGRGPQPIGLGREGGEPPQLMPDKIVPGQNALDRIMGGQGLPVNPALAGILNKNKRDVALEKLQREFEQVRLRKEELLLEKAKEKSFEWKQGNSGTYFWRTGPGGTIETQGNPFLEGGVKSIYFDEGVMLTMGNELVPIPTATLEVVKNHIGEITDRKRAETIHSIDMASGQIFFQDGRVERFDKETMLAVITAEQRKEQYKKDTYDYRQKLRIEYAHLGQSFKLDAAGAKAVLDMHRYIDTRLGNGKMTPDGAYNYAQQQLSLFPALKYDKTGILEGIRDHAVEYALNASKKFSQVQKSEITSAAKTQAEADEILHLLSKPEVQAHVGRIAGTIANISRAITGEAATNPDVVTFHMLLSNVRDELIRDRTGAVVNAEELVQYRDMLGSETKSVDALRVRLSTLIEIMQRQRNGWWELALQEAFNTTNIDQYRHRIPQFQSKYADDFIERGLSDEDMY